MNRSLALVLLAFSTFVLAAPVPRDAKAEAVAGVWQLEELVAYGSKIPFDAAVPRHWTIDGKSNLTQQSGPTGLESGKSVGVITFDPEKKSVDLRYADMTTAYLGRFELTGDKLTISCKMKIGGDRPTTLDAGPEVYLWTLERVKEAKK